LHSGSPLGALICTNRFTSKIAKEQTRFRMFHNNVMILRILLSKILFNCQHVN